MNPWVLIDKSGEIIEVPKDTPDAIEVALLELAALKKGFMSDEQLQASVSKGFANPNHMEELLKRTDIPKNRLLRVRANLSSALLNNQIHKENLQAIISKLKSAKTIEEFDQVLAELHHPNYLIYLGRVADGSLIYTNAKKGNDYMLGLTKVKIDPVSEADALYLGQDGIIHIDEVKNTTNALRQKLLKTPEQLERIREWRDLALGNREIGVIIETESGWTDLFAARRGETAALRTLIDEEVPLTIASHRFSVSQMEDLWKAVEIKSEELKKQGNSHNWNDFFSQMQTIKDAETFLGFSII
ncbi:hypothetical protein NIES4071_25970 [Calothrix sp. NIES-4071]|nr:hypothetical protein NIES4071_25970 [Calothrix sp. NIES-4071]BAZ56919.1 hypothetical protein NIES4105_25910 [Calothrix sp. NIES-4105]